MASVGSDLEADPFDDTFPAPLPGTLLASPSSLPPSVSHYMAPPSAGPNVRDMMKLAGDISTMAAKAKQTGAQTREQADRQNEKIKQLEGQIASIDRRMDTVFARQDKIEHRLASTMEGSNRRIKQLEAQVTKLCRKSGSAPRAESVSPGF